MMKIPSATASALTTIRQAMARLDRDAAETAKAAASPETVPPATALVDTKLNRLQVEAGVKVIETANEMLGALLDEHA